VDTTVVKPDVRTHDQVPHRLRHEYLATGRLAHDSGGQVRGHPADIAVSQLDLSGVHSYADGEPMGSEVVAERGREPDAASGPVERGEQTVAGGLHVPAAVHGMDWRQDIVMDSSKVRHELGYVEPTSLV
jgi:hypothetical protein